MAKIHIVKQDEHLSGIAAENGFGDFHIILDHPRNAALKARRDPHVLFPGDEVFIPDRTEKTEQGVTAKVHRFQLADAPLFLRIRFRDLDNKPVGNAPYELLLEAKETPDKNKTDKDGVIVPHEIGKLVKNGELKVTHKLPPLAKDDSAREEKFKFDLKVGRLNPETMLSGQQARLNNLGYFAGFTVDDNEQMIWAIEEFQCDHMNQKPVKKKPEIEPESTDPNKNTGVKDRQTQKAIRDAHGI